jgi:hypothetical protein
MGKYNKLIELVTILPDNAEPRVGDVVMVTQKMCNPYPDSVGAIIQSNDEGYPYLGDGRTVIPRLGLY